MRTFEKKERLLGIFAIFACNHGKKKEDHIEAKILGSVGTLQGEISSRIYGTSPKKIANFPWMLRQNLDEL